MSIGIAYTLQDRVLLVADTRSIQGFGETDEASSDEAEKIYDISPRTAAAGVGVEQGIKIAVDLLRVSVNESSSLERISNALEACLEAGWNGLTQMVSSEVDITAPHLKVGLLMAGVAENRVFSMGLIRSYKFKTPLVVNTFDYDGIMMGMDSFEVSDKFQSRAAGIINGHRHSKDKNNNDLLAEKILALAEKTIGEIAADNKMVSSKTVHTIIWK